MPSAPRMPADSRRGRGKHPGDQGLTYLASGYNYIKSTDEVQVVTWMFSGTASAERDAAFQLISQRYGKVWSPLVAGTAVLVFFNRGDLSAVIDGSCSGSPLSRPLAEALGFARIPVMVLDGGAAENCLVKSVTRIEDEPTV